MFPNAFDQGYYISWFMSMKWWFLLVLSEDFLLVEHISSSPFEMCMCSLYSHILYIISTWCLITRQFTLYLWNLITFLLLVLLNIVKNDIVENNVNYPRTHKENVWLCTQCNIFALLMYVIIFSYCFHLSLSLE